MAEMEKPLVLILAKPSDLGNYAKHFQASDLLSVKTVTQRGASWQVGLPKEVAQALGLKKAKEKLAFLKTKISGKHIYILTSTKALVPFVK